VKKCRSTSVTLLQTINRKFR